MTTNKDILEEARKIDTSTPSATATSTETALVPVAQESHQGTDTVRNFIRENPGPSLLIGAGLAWMFVSRERARSRPLSVRMHDRASSMREHAHNAAEHASESYQEAKSATANTLEEAKELTVHKLEQATELAHRGADRVKSRYENMLEDNPLALGACAVAAGLAIGLLLPPTQRENEIMGEARDSLMDQAIGIVNEARNAAVNTLRSGKESVEAKLIEAKDEAKETALESIEEAKTAMKKEMSSEDRSLGMKTERKNKENYNEQR